MKGVKMLNIQTEQRYNEIVENYSDMIFRIAYQYLFNKYDAEDIVQEVFIAIWESDKKYNSYHGFRAFLYDSVKNRCLNYLKHQEVERRHAEILLQEQDEEDEDHRLMREEMYRALHRAVDELPERCRQVFKLHLQGKKNEEIAQMLELSVETVKTQKKKAMYFLRERLGRLYYLLMILNIIDL